MFTNSLNPNIKLFLLSYSRILKNLIKSCIRETKHLTDADSSTDAIGGWTKITPKPDFFEKRKISSGTQKLQNI